MRRHVVLLVVLLTVVGTAAGVSYAVLALPESGDVQRPVVPFRQWAEENGLTIARIRQECESVSRSSVRREACVSSLTEQAREQWRGSAAGREDVWTASELSGRRNSYLGVGAIILGAVAVGVLAGRLLPPKRITP